MQNDKELADIKQLCEGGGLDEAIEQIRMVAEEKGKARPSVVNLAMEYAVVIYKDVAGKHPPTHPPTHLSTYPNP